MFENVGDIPGQHPEDNLICDRRFAFIRSRIDWNQKADRVMAWFAFNDEPTIDNAFNMTDEFFVRIDDRNGGRVVEISTGMGFTQDNEPFVRIPVLTEEMPVIGSGEYEWLTITGESIDDAHIKAAQHIIDNYDWNGQPR